MRKALWGRGLYLPGCYQVWAPGHPDSAGGRRIAAGAGAAAVAGNVRGGASPRPPLKSSGTEERAGPQRILGTEAEISSSLYYLTCLPTPSPSPSSHLGNTPKQRPSTSPSLPLLEEGQGTTHLLTKRSISPRLKDVAGPTEALYKSRDAFTAASPSPQGAQQGAQHTLHH